MIQAQTDFLRSHRSASAYQCTHSFRPSVNAIAVACDAIGTDCVGFGYAVAKNKNTHRKRRKCLFFWLLHKTVLYRLKNCRGSFFCVRVCDSWHTNARVLFKLNNIPVVVNGVAVGVANVIGPSVVVTRRRQHMAIFVHPH